jgi:hypothetical protein
MLEKVICGIQKLIHWIAGSLSCYFRQVYPNANCYQPLVLQFHKPNTDPSSVNRLLHLGNVQFDMGIHLQEFVMGTVNFVLDILLQVRHLKLSA